MFPKVQARRDPRTKSAKSGHQAYPKRNHKHRPKLSQRLLLLPSLGLNRNNRLLPSRERSRSHLRLNRPRSNNPNHSSQDTATLNRCPIAKTE